jgi:hypothetical protein
MKMELFTKRELKAACKGIFLFNPKVTVDQVRKILDFPKHEWEDIAHYIGILRRNHNKRPGFFKRLLYW